MCQNRIYYADKAVQLKMFGGYNCSQAVTAALADQTGLSEEQLKSVAAGFCAGMGSALFFCFSKSDIMASRRNSR